MAQCGLSWQGGADRVGGVTEALDEILKGVSRSFYLTLRWLPMRMRAPVSLAYLLARASDTIADSETVSVAERERMLREYSAALQAGELAQVQEDIQKNLVPWLPDDREARLMSQLVAIEVEVNAQNPEAQKLVRWVLQPIIEGQLWDLTYFAEGVLTRVESRELLERYTYLVAGSVGEFWTKVGFLTCGSSYARESEAAMLRRGKQYGQALQLINILRDTARDEELGRIYLPDDDFAKWLAQAQTWLDEGFRYCSDLPAWRLRVPTVLPALLGEETLEKIENATPAEMERGVKVSRAQVYGNVWQALLYK